MGRLVLLLLGLGGIVLLLRWIVTVPPELLSRYLKQAAIGLLAALLIFMAATGRLHWIAAVIGSLFLFIRRLLPLLRLAPFLHSLYNRLKSTRAGGHAAPGRQSRVSSRYLSMTLDHDSGRIRGEVLEGRFRGRALDDLTLDELLDLLAECRRQDPEGVPLLETYLDRNHGDEWRQGGGGERSGEDPPLADGGMTREQALQILGLEDDADKQEIIAAHRRLMQKLHPDRGGSDFLAAQINRAKDLLLGRRSA